MSKIITKKNTIQGTINAPGDKSITHRAIICAALSEGDTKISHFLRCADTISTIACLQQMGVSIEDLGNNEILVHGKGLHGLSQPKSILNCGNSGTTSRLLLAILSAQDFDSELHGDDALNKRSMSKLIKPLEIMGASIKSRNNNDSTPLTISGKKLKGISYESSSLSPQIKSALLFAGLYGDSDTTISEHYKSWNLTERVLKHFGAHITETDKDVTITPTDKLIAKDIVIPGDLSSSTFLMAAALILPGSELLIKNVCVNESRIGFINAVKKMGGNINFLNPRDGIEPCTDILVSHSKLKGITITPEMIPSTIDELPILSVLSCYAEGTTIISDASELKSKETNRIDALVENLTRMGGDIRAEGDQLIINGSKHMHGAIVGSRLDHRIAMCMAIAGTLSSGTTEIIGSDCVKVSYPDFYKDLSSISY